MEKWGNKILKWYALNKRELPWRNTDNPYKIWISEVILQQTRVNQGLDYYNRFIEKYPTISKLAAASEHEVLKLWQGLGYYSRARNMHHTARYIKQVLHGIFPSDFTKLHSLKGIGDYTAAAIASFAFNLPYPVLDGNVMRVYSRFLGITEPIDTGTGRKKLQSAAAEFLVKEKAADFNQAMMELGAMVCLPKNPLCNDCPLQPHCYAYAHELTNEIPIKKFTTKKKERFMNYLVIQSGKKMVIRKRLGSDIWKGLYDFPCIETDSFASLKNLITTQQWHDIFKNKKIIIHSVSDEYTHILTHRKLHAVFVKIELDRQKIYLPEGCMWINIRQVQDYAVPRLIERYISANLERESKYKLPAISHQL